MKLHKFTVTCGEEMFNLHANACAATYHRPSVASAAITSLYVLSAVGPSVSVKACAAALNRAERETTTVKFFGMGQEAIWWDKREISGSYAGMRVQYTQLAMDCWHMMAISKDKQLLLSDDDETIWRHLTGDKFTTPMLREWLPHIIHALKTKKAFDDSMKTFGCRATRLKLTQKTLDEIVTTLVASGVCKIPEVPNAPAA